MSSAYASFAPTRGKVLLRTTFGDLDIELWPDQCPSAVRGFVSNCSRGAYDGSPFHRVIPGFIAQAGDVSGGAPLGDSVEAHPRIRFDTHGFVGAAVPGSPMFFITLGEHPSLQGKHSGIGIVAGDTGFNLRGLQSGAENVTHRVVSTEVLANPFPDLAEAEEREKERIRSGKSGGKKRRRREVVQSASLLSFGGGDDDDDDGNDGNGASAAINNSDSGKARKKKNALANPDLIDARPEDVSRLVSRPFSGPEIDTPDHVTLPNREVKLSHETAGEVGEAENEVEENDETKESEVSAPPAVEAPPPPSTKASSSSKAPSALEARLAKYKSQRGKKAHKEEDTLAKLAKWRERSGK